MNTASGYKNRILEYVARRDIAMSDGKAMKLAIKLHRRQARMTDLDLARILQYSDTTGETAAKNVDTERLAAQAA